jgi:hypothetical protein
LTDKDNFSLADNAIDADALATSAVTEIQNGLATASSISTPAQIASQVRTELTTELARINVDLSTRLAAANYTTPPTTSQIATAVEAALLNDADGQALLAAIQTAVQALFDQQADIPVSTLVSLIAAQITADHGSGSYTTANLSAVALEATAQGIKAKTDNLPSDPADQSELVTLINTKASQASVNAIPTTPLLAANYTAPDNAAIAAIQAKTNALPDDPADQSELAQLIAAIPQGLTTQQNTRLTQLWQQAGFDSAVPVVRDKEGDVITETIGTTVITHTATNAGDTVTTERQP